MLNRNVTQGVVLLAVLGMGSFSALAEVKINLFNEIVVPTELANKIIGVRLSDLVDVNPTAIPGSANVAELINKNAQSLFSNDNVDIVHDVFLQKIPTQINGKSRLDLVAIVKYKNGQMNFEKLVLEFEKSSLNLSDYKIEKSIIANSVDMDFEAKVGLVDRKLILEDVSKNVKLVFPIGVGSFDEGVLNEGKVSLLTPRFQHGFLDKRVVISKREKPKYFKGKPFIRILKGSDPDRDMTPIAFHIEINDSFIRGFDSHGCMRMREMDLMAAHDIVMLGSDKQIPLTIKYRTDDLSDSPVSKRNKVYKTIVNKGSSTSPFFILDKDNLVQLTLMESKPAPLEALVDDVNDNYEDVFSYDTEAQMKEQDARRSNECKAKVLSGAIKGDDKSFTKCMDEGKRKETLADKIYRKYMGIDSIQTSFESRI